MYLTSGILELSREINDGAELQRNTEYVTRCVLRIPLNANLVNSMTFRESSYLMVLAANSELVRLIAGRLDRRHIFPRAAAPRTNHRRMNVGVVIGLGQARLVLFTFHN